jgi:hypothetical protein
MVAPVGSWIVAVHLAGQGVPFGLLAPRTSAWDGGPVSGPDDMAGQVPMVPYVR